MLNSNLLKFTLLYNFKIDFNYVNQGQACFFSNLISLALQTYVAEFHILLGCKTI